MDRKRMPIMATSRVICLYTDMNPLGGIGYSDPGCHLAKNRVLFKPGSLWDGLYGKKYKL
jgi:hypothetical protein